MYQIYAEENGQDHLSVTVPEPAGTVTLNVITKYVW